MRAAVLGVCGGDNCFDWSTASTRLTHGHVEALAGAVVVANACRLSAAGRNAPFDPERVVTQLTPCIVPTQYWATSLRTLAADLAAGKSVAEFAADIGLSAGVTGYIAHTVPVAVYAFCRHADDYRKAVESVIRLGGDTDTVAAITGALVGARVGKAGIPKEWLDRYIDWPRSVAHLEEIGRRLAEGKWRSEPQPGVPLAWWAVPVRNVLFFVVVIGHIIRRLLPPY
jgi:ADP-ribosylglycohydrolase